MTIENIVNIVKGEIVNSPKVTKVESATIYQSKVESGDLFFCVDNSEASKAVEKGAYAIVYEGNLEIEDSEIAYIKVDSIKKATTNFLRYILTQKESKIYYISDIATTYIKQITNKKSTAFTILPDSWQKSFETILNSNYDIFVTNSKEYASAITPNYIEYQKKADGYIISSSLLRTTFRLEKFVYQNIEIPPFFIEELKKAISFAKELQLNYDINKIRYNKKFLPYFIDNNLNSVTKGSTQKVLISVDKIDTINKALSFLKEQGRWSKSIVLTPPKTKIELIDRPFWVKSSDEAKEILKKEHFNYAFLYNLDINSIINKEQNIVNLFD